MDAKQQGKALAGAGVLLVAGIFYFVATKSDANDTATCAMTTAAVPLFVAAVSEGRTAAVIDGIGGVLTTTTCKAALKNLQKKPDKAVEVEVRTPAQTVTQAVTLPQLVTPPPRPTTPRVSVSVIIQCFGAYSGPNQSILLRWCYDGLIRPPG